MKDNQMCMHSSYHATKMLILGLIVLANVYWPFIGWANLIGILLVLGGLIKLAMPSKMK